MTLSTKTLHLLVAMAIAAPLAAHAADAGGAVGQAVGAAILKPIVQPLAEASGRAIRKSIRELTGQDVAEQKAALVAFLAKAGTIAVIRPFEPRAFAVAHLDDGGAPAGFLALDGAGDQRTPGPEQRAFTAKVKQMGAAPISELLANDIAAQFARLGHKAEVAAGPWEVTDDYSTIDLDKIKSAADAVIVIKPTIVGFLSADADHPFRPAITAIITVLKPATGETMYRGFYASGWHASGWHLYGPRWRYAETEWKFDRYEEMASQPKKSAEALADAAMKISEALVEDMKR